MSALDPIDALVQTGEDGSQELRCPAVGVYRFAPADGSLLGAGEACGWLYAVGQSRPLRVPVGVAGRVIERRLGALGYQDLLLRLEPVDAEAAAAPRAGEVDAEADLVYRSPMAGRFYRRPAPDAEPYIADGEVLQPGKAIGLLEVMKTFSPLRFETTAGMPESVRVTRFLVAEGDEVEQGQALLALEPAE